MLVGNFVVGTRHQLAALLVGNVMGKDATDQVFVGHLKLGDAGAFKATYVTRRDALAGFDDDFVAYLQVEIERFAAQAFGHQVQLGSVFLAQRENVVLEEDVEHLFVVVTQRAQQDRHWQLAAAIDAGEQRVLGVELEIQPRATVRNHASGIEQLARAMRLAAVVVEKHARRAMQLRDDDALGAVDDEGAGVGHQGQFAHVDLLLLDVLDRLVRRLAVVDHQAHGNAQRRTVAHAARTALALVERRFAEAIVHVLQGGTAGVARNREYRFQRRMQALRLAVGGRDVVLQEFLVGINLDSQQEGHVKHRWALAEVLADSLLFSKRVGHGRIPPRNCVLARRHQRKEKLQENRKSKTTLR